MKFQTIQRLSVAPPVVLPIVLHLYLWPLPFDRRERNNLFITAEIIFNTNIYMLNHFNENFNKRE